MQLAKAFIWVSSLQTMNSNALHNTQGLALWWGLRRPTRPYCDIGPQPAVSCRISCLCQLVDQQLWGHVAFIDIYFYGTGSRQAC